MSTKAFADYIDYIKGGNSLVVAVALLIVLIKAVTKKYKDDDDDDDNFFELLFVQFILKPLTLVLVIVFFIMKLFEGGAKFNDVSSYIMIFMTIVYVIPELVDFLSALGHFL